MGLDMHLTKSTYIGAEYDHRKISGTIKLKKEGKDIFIKSRRVSEIRESVAYWRKANAIHAWFVSNCQDGNDDCKEYDVTQEQLEELRGICEKIMNNPIEGENLLPTQDGFFFGSTEYDEYYMEDIKQTKRMLDGILSEATDNDVSYYYRASW